MVPRGLTGGHNTRHCCEDEQTRLGLVQKGERVLPADLLALIKAPPWPSAAQTPGTGTAAAAASAAGPTSAALPHQPQVETLTDLENLSLDQNVGLHIILRFRF